MPARPSCRYGPVRERPRGHRPRYLADGAPAAGPSGGRVRALPGSRRTPPAFRAAGTSRDHRGGRLAGRGRRRRLLGPRRGAPGRARRSPVGGACPRAGAVAAALCADAVRRGDRRRGGPRRRERGRGAGPRPDRQPGHRRADRRGDPRRSGRVARREPLRLPGGALVLVPGRGTARRRGVSVRQHRRRLLGLPHAAVALRRATGCTGRRCVEPRPGATHRGATARPRRAGQPCRPRPARPGHPTPDGRWPRWRCGSTCG